jgi:hypothetical protein
MARQLRRRAHGFLATLKHATVPASQRMEREFTRFVEQPTGKNYLAARNAVMRVSRTLVQTTDLLEIAQLLGDRQFAAARARLDNLPPAAALSPRVHLLAADLAEATGDSADMELEHFLFIVCVRGVLATGDGSERSPYSVCQAADEHDVLHALQLQPVSQAIVPRGARTFDVVQCAEARSVWFDLTVVIPARKARRQVVSRPTARKVGRVTK